MPPRVLQIDPMPVCNLGCPLCETGNHTGTRRAPLMPLETFVRILDEAEGFDEIHLFNRGESLLHPKIGAMIAAAGARGFATRLHSNLCVPEAKLREAIGAGLTALTASIDGVTQEAYVAYRRGGQVERALRNLELAAALQGAHPVVVTWQFLVNRFNEHELQAARARASSLGVGFAPLPIGVGEDVPDLHPPPDLPALIETWVARDNPWAVRDTYGGRFPTATPGARCGYLDHTAVIHPDRAVGPCCMTVSPASDFGHLDQGRLSEVLDNAAFRAARALFDREDGPASQTVCDRCPATANARLPAREAPRPRAAEALAADLCRLVPDPELALYVSTVGGEAARARAEVALACLDEERARHAGWARALDLSGGATLAAAHDLLFSHQRWSMLSLPPFGLVALGSQAMGKTICGADMEFMACTLERTPELDDLYLPAILGTLVALGAVVDPWCASAVLLAGATSTAGPHALDDQLDHPALRAFASRREPDPLSLTGEPMFVDLIGRQVTGSVQVGHRVRRRKLAVMRADAARVRECALALARYNLERPARPRFLEFTLLALTVAERLDDPGLEQALVEHYADPVATLRWGVAMRPTTPVAAALADRLAAIEARDALLPPPAT